MVRFVIGLILLLLFSMILISAFIDPNVENATLGLLSCIAGVFVPGYLLVCFGWFAHSEKKRKERWLRNTRR